MMRAYYMSLTVVAVILGTWWYSVKPVRYVVGDLKYVEYHDGVTCSFSVQDNREQSPYMCDSTERMWDLFGYRPGKPARTLPSRP
jgi:hypothetical protein